jgi:hypothetical protein
MPDRVEAEGVEARRFLKWPSGILGGAKSEVDVKIARNRGKETHQT